MVACENGTPREKLLGTAVSAVNGLASAGILLAAQTAGLPLDAAVVATGIVGNLVGYTGDVLVAKQCFDRWDPAARAYVPMALDQWDLRARFAWYLRSLASRSFLRFVLTVVIDTLVSLAIIDMVVQLLDDMRVKFPFRDALVAGGVSVLTFQVFVNEVRFNYAYTRNASFTHDLLVYIWASVLLALYMLLRKLNGLPDKKA